MMTWHRIWAIAYRHLVQLPTDFNKLSSVIYWPFIDIVLFGFIGLWSAQKSGQANDPFVLLTGIVLWQVVNRASLGVALNLLEELWSRNLTNLFATPLKLSEWIASIIVEGLIVLSMLIMFCISVVYVMYGYNILVLGWWLIPMVLLAFMSGLSIGFFSGISIVYWGQRVQSLVWMASWAFSVVSGAFYPIHILPLWLQKIAYSMPLCYVFTAAEKVIRTGASPVNELLTGFALSVGYLTVTLIIFVQVFRISKKRGLARLMD